MPEPLAGAPAGHPAGLRADYSQSVLGHQIGVGNPQNAFSASPRAMSPVPSIAHSHTGFDRGALRPHPAPGRGPA
jgi:hypothetical protein